MGSGSHYQHFLSRLGCPSRRQGLKHNDLEKIISVLQAFCQELSLVFGVVGEFSPEVKNPSCFVLVARF